MSKTLHADLLTAQETGYPTAGGGQPAIAFVLTAKGGGTTHDYSFDPTLTTNLLKYIEQNETPETDEAEVLISNYDRTFPTNVLGYYVDVGWGFNTSSGLRYSNSPRLWVTAQKDVSAGPPYYKQRVDTYLVLRGVWQAILNSLEILIGNSPRYKDENGVLAGKTIYGVLEYMIETTLTTVTGYTFTLDALGDQDDGLINSIIPFPTVAATALVDGDEYRILTVGTTDFTAVGALTNNVGVYFTCANGPGSGTGTATDITNAKVLLNQDAPAEFETYGNYFKRLLALTNCELRVEPAGAFKIIYPQSGDAVDTTYHAESANGHPFYQLVHVRVGERGNGTPQPTRIDVWGGWQDTEVPPDFGDPIYLGQWFDPDHYTTPPTYDGPLWEVVHTIWEQGYTSNAACEARAEAEGYQVKHDVQGMFVTLPMDLRVEMFDNVRVVDTR